MIDSRLFHQMPFVTDIVDLVGHSVAVIEDDTYEAGMYSIKRDGLEMLVP